jgi:CHAT domain-containing protein/Tfp pilus assembly protein PilF
MAQPLFLRPFQSKYCSWIVYRGLILSISLSLVQIQCFAGALYACGEAKPDAGKVSPVQESQQIRQLEPGKPIERELMAGQSHSYQMTHATGKYVKLAVDQRGIDVLVKLSGPDGKPITEFNSEKGTQREETVEWVAEETGSYRLDVVAKHNDAAAGRYEIQVVEIRAATESDHALHEARKLNTESYRLRQAGKYDEARSLVERILEIHKQVLGSNHPGVATDLNNLATLYSIKGEYVKAELLAQRTLAIRKIALRPEHPDVATTHNLLAIIYKQRGEYAKAEPYYLSTLTIAEKAFGPERPEVSAYLNNIASFYYEIGNYTKAEPFLQRALTIQEKTLGPEHAEVATTLNNLANIYSSLGDSTKAELLYGRSLAIREKSLGPDHPDVATSLSNLANIYLNRDNQTRAEQLYQRALAIREKALGQEHPLVARSLNNLAIIYKVTRSYAKARHLIQCALTMQEKSLGPEHPDVAISLTHIADIYYELGDYARAEPIYQRALDIRNKSLVENDDVAISLNNLANLYSDRGDYIKAEMFYRRALTIRERILGPEHSYIASTLNNLAILYRRRGDYAQAKSLYQRALTMQEKLLGPDHTEVGRYLNNMAVAYLESGDFVKAEPLLQRALTIQEKAQGMEHPETARYLANLANLYSGRGDHAQAEPLHLHALSIREKTLGPEHHNVADSLTYLADLYRKMGDYVKSEPLYRRALAITEKSLGPEHPDVAITLNGLALLYATQGDIAQVISLQSRANAIDERNLALNLSIGSERQKLIYLSLFSKRGDFTLSLHSRAAPNDPQALNLAFTTLLRRKGRGLDAMTNTIATLRRHATPQDQELFDQLAEARSQLATFTLKEPDAAKPDIYRKRLEELEHEVDKREAELSSRSTEFRKQTQPVTLAAVQTALPTRSALIEFAIYSPLDPKTQKSNPPRYLAYLLPAQGQPKWADLGEAVLIDRAVNAWRKALRNPNQSNVKRLARALDEKVMRPVRSLLGQIPGNMRRLLIAPDGSLNLIPFHALVDERNRYLVERYSISYLTSGRDLLRLQTSELSKNAPLIVANPLFSTGETAAAIPLDQDTANSPSGDQAGNEAPAQNGSREIYFQALPGTRREALAIKALLPEASVLLREDATEAALKEVHSPRILHIATHGFFLDDQEAPPPDTRGFFSDNPLRISDPRMMKWAARIENPLLRSGLALAGVNQHRSGDDDGLLTALETASLDLWGTKLVVLSACDTGVGEVKNREGVYGLRRALVLAGSETQVISLWPVSDRETRRLMTGYYRRLQKGEGRGEALRQIQLEMLKGAKLRHPYYWASFIQAGEWANLDGQR